MHDAPLPSFPADLDPLAPDGVVAGFSPLELGAFYRLARYAWRQDPACTLPDDPNRLAAVVGVSLEQFSEIWPRIALAVEPLQGGRLVLPAAAALHRKLSDRQARRIAACTKAARCRWDPGPDPPSHPDPSGKRHASRADANAVPPTPPGLQFSRSSAPTLERSNPMHNSESAPEMVIGVLGAGARAEAEARFASWRQDRCREMLEKAWTAWVTDGYTTAPPSKIRELLAGPYTTPARVEALVAEAGFLIAAHKAGSARRRPNPVGFVIHGLGLSGARPFKVPIVSAQRWLGREASVQKSIEAMAALQARARNIQNAAAPADAGRRTAL